MIKIIKTIVCFLIISSMAVPALAETREAVSIGLYPLIVELNGSAAAVKNYFGSGLRVWLGKEGLEYYYSHNFPDYTNSHLKFMHKIDEHAYWGVGLGGARQEGLAGYNESFLMACIGSEYTMGADWLITAYELGYAFSSVSNVSDPSGYLPGNRLFVDVMIGLGINK